MQAALEGVPGVKKVIAASGTAIVMYEKGKVKPEELIKALEEKGFSGLMLEVFNLRVAGMGCPGCPEKVEEALIKFSGVRSVSFYLDREDTIEVECEKGKVSVQRLFGILKEKGFSAEILEEKK